MRVTFGARLPVSVELGAHGEVRVVIDPDLIRELIPESVFVDQENGDPPITLVEGSPDPTVEVSNAVTAEAVKLADAFIAAPIELSYLIT